MANKVDDLLQEIQKDDKAGSRTPAIMEEYDPSNAEKIVEQKGDDDYSDSDNPER